MFSDTAEIRSLLRRNSTEVFFSGIGGISMSAIALALKQKGLKIYGSDIAHNDNTDHLEKNGVDIFYKHDKKNLQNANILVYNARIKQDNPEIIAATETGIPVIPRAAMLGILMDEYKTQIGVTGTHGKSTTTSMISDIFITAEKSPTFFIGAVYPPVNSAYQIGREDYFIFEADEYADSFLYSKPSIGVILNLEMDHPDYYENIDAVISSFNKYILGTKEYVVINKNDGNIKKALNGYEGKVLTFSLNDESADIYAKNLNCENNSSDFDVYMNNEKYLRLSLQVIGDHNINNALAAVGAAYLCGISPESIERSLNAFKGASRRFERKGFLNGAEVVDDYAHHPTELRTLIKSVNKMNYKNVWYVIQPHTYTRMRDFFDEFVAVLSDCDKLIITDIYSASEKDNYNISSRDLASALPSSVYIKEFTDIADYLKRNVSENDLVILIGAGDIIEVTKMIAE